MPDSTKGPHDDQGGQAVIETRDGHEYITIRIPVSALPVIVSGIDMGCGGPAFKVTNPKAFARELVITLNNEATVEGPPRIHAAMDQAIIDCWEDGDADGTEDLEERETT